jgi:hypothetical protein
MRSLRQWLLNHGGELLATQTLLGYLPTRVSVVDADHCAVGDMRVGGRFLHCVEIVENISPVHIDAEISSGLGNTKQLGFVQAGAVCGSSWNFSVHLDPKQRGEEESCLVECHSRTSGKSTIRTALTKTDTHESDAVDLNVNIL